MKGKREGNREREKEQITKKGTESIKKVYQRKDDAQKKKRKREEENTKYQKSKKKEERKKKGIIGVNLTLPNAIDQLREI